MTSFFSSVKWSSCDIVQSQYLWSFVKFVVLQNFQGVEAQTLANVYLALENDLEIIPVRSSLINSYIFFPTDCIIYWRKEKEPKYIMQKILYSQ